MKTNLIIKMAVNSLIGIVIGWSVLAQEKSSDLRYVGVEHSGLGSCEVLMLDGSSEEIRISFRVLGVSSQLVLEGQRLLKASWSGNDLLYIYQAEEKGVQEEVVVKLAPSAGVYPSQIEFSLTQKMQHEGSFQLLLEKKCVSMKLYP